MTELCQVDRTATGAKVTPPSALDNAKAAFRKYLHMPDDEVLDFVFGIYFANCLDGDPVWGGIVGAPGDAKTEVLRSLTGERIYALSNLTEKTLISGLPADQATEKKDPSLLPKLNGKLLVVKDLTPLISGNADRRNTVLGQLRDAYDGSMSMAFGTGETKAYTSRFGMLFGVTPAIEACWSVINSLGERFLYYRCNGGESLDKVHAALANSNRKSEMRAALEAAASLVLAQECPKDVCIDDEVARQIAHLADFVARARTPVQRLGRSEEIVAMPDPEVGTRLVGQLIQLGRGISVSRGMKHCDGSVLPIIRRVALSGIPKLRLELLRHLSVAKEPIPTMTLSQCVKCGTGTVNRAAQDLWRLELLDCVLHQIGAATKYDWKLSDLARNRLTEAGLTPL